MWFQSSLQPLGLGGLVHLASTATQGLPKSISVQHTAWTPQAEAGRPRKTDQSPHLTQEGIPRQSWHAPSRIQGGSCQNAPGSPYFPGSHDFVLPQASTQLEGAGWCCVETWRSKMRGREEKGRWVSRDLGRRGRVLSPFQGSKVHPQINKPPLECHHNRKAPATWRHR